MGNWILNQTATINFAKNEQDFQHHLRTRDMISHFPKADGFD